MNWVSDSLSDYSRLWTSNDFCCCLWTCAMSTETMPNWWPLMVFFDFDIFDILDCLICNNRLWWNNKFHSRPTIKQHKNWKLSNKLLFPNSKYIQENYIYCSRQCQIGLVTKFESYFSKMKCYNAIFWKSKRLWIRINFTYSRLLILFTPKTTKRKRKEFRISVAYVFIAWIYMGCTSTE